MSDRRFAPRTASIAAGSLRLVVAAALSTLATVLLIGVAAASAQVPDDVGGKESAGDTPVTLGLPDDVFPDNGWFDSGPAVPLMALSTLLMMGVGAGIIAGRCRRDPVPAEQLPVDRVPVDGVPVDRVPADRLPH